VGPLSDAELAIFGIVMGALGTIALCALFL
jgi:hypothetical protein